MVNISKGFFEREIPQKDILRTQNLLFTIDWRANKRNSLFLIFTYNKMILCMHENDIWKLPQQIGESKLNRI